MNEFGQALDSMNSGAMKPNKELMEKLKSLDPKSLKGIPKEQLDAMRKKMREHAERLDQQQKKNGGDIGEEPGEMDGDHDSAMTSAGWGNDEDYGYYGESKRLKELAGIPAKKD